MSIFKANDIRGIYCRDLKDEDAYRIGRAFVSFLKVKEVVVVRDNRVSSPALKQALIKGLVDEGADVLDLGLGDTPYLYFVLGKLKKPGIMITASHNPAEYNGFYLCDSEAVPINIESGIKEIESLSRKFFRKSAENKQIRAMSFLEDYIEHIFSFITKDKLRKIKIVVDAGNGMGGWIAPHIYAKFGFEVIPLFWELDGTYPNRGPNTADYANLEKLSKKVVQTKADFGIAFDGDADRASFVDEKGHVIEGSITGAIIAKHLLKKFGSRNVVHSSTCSMVLPEVIEKYGGRAIKERVGRTFMQASMKKYDALFGAEDTGHYFYKNNWYADSGIITGLIMCEIYAKQRKKMSLLVEPFRKYYMTRQVNFDFSPEESKFELILNEIKKLNPEKIDLLDGIQAYFKGYWVSIRKSQTEPLLRLSLEGKNKSLVERRKRELINLIKHNL